MVMQIQQNLQCIMTRWNLSLSRACFVTTYYSVLVADYECLHGIDDRTDKCKKNKKLVKQWLWCWWWLVNIDSKFRSKQTIFVYYIFIHVILNYLSLSLSLSLSLLNPACKHFEYDWHPPTITWNWTTIHTFSWWFFSRYILHIQQTLISWEWFLKIYQHYSVNWQ